MSGVLPGDEAVGEMSLMRVWTRSDGQVYLHEVEDRKGRKIRNLAFSPFSLVRIILELKKRSMRHRQMLLSFVALYHGP